jgi:hypothetical protein
LIALFPCARLGGMKKWIFGLVASFIIIAITLIVDTADPSEDVLKGTENMVESQMTQQQKEALNTEGIFEIIEVFCAVGAFVSIGVNGDPPPVTIPLVTS